MQARPLHENGEPSEVMRLTDVSPPTPGEGQVLLRVRAAHINFPNALLCRGQYQVRPPLPFPPGVQICGETEDGRPATPTRRCRTLLRRVAAAVARPCCPRRRPGRRRGRRPAHGGRPRLEGAGMKLNFARLNQEISGLEVKLLGEEGLLYDDWTMRRPELVDFTGRDAGYRYLRSKGNSIEGGTSEVLLNIVAERVLGLPAEPRTDKDVAWKDLAR
ncbi:hypothetical protein SVIOM342S_00315 [Streptomyces violaceorubidus]